MASLIITIISIALVAVAAVMGVYYGGTAFSNSSVKAYAAQTIQTMQQIKAAVYVYQSLNPNYGSLTTPRLWGIALNSNNNQYLSLPYYSGVFCSTSEYNSFNINYGQYGNLLDWSNGGVGCNVVSPLSGTGHIGFGALNVVADPTGNHLYVVWLAALAQYATIATYQFYTNLCYTINQQMGAVPYASNLTLVNNVGYTTLSIPNGGDTTARPGFGENPTAFTGLSNICAINPNESSGTTFEEYEFAIPIY